MKLLQLKTIVPLLVVGSLLGWILVTSLPPRNSTPTTITKNGITVGIEKTRYTKVENITFWVENNRNNKIFLRSPCPWHIEHKKDDKWEVSYYPGCAALTVVVYLPPGGTKTWTWDQHRYPGRIDPGDYRVVLYVARERFYLPFEIVWSESSY
ncbi:MAG: hypothetical protein GWO20_01915 [Candidatus Korarchaeota archaeon]|nr:hypothetical protein [Candidatus Korarchaeota archaeon]NIU82275.1 hypothetical protein [Candidatus Thorarchaeota archaeon]NIW12729.1 hypothetical protein [Candidatus Thorarchaeota archaeon]NIW50940.1 hypothetical protein [Candidatus Korarchaeota archaeon]